MRTLNSIIPSKRLIASYIFDWIAIAAIAAVGAAWNGITPFHRPFSLVDLSISYPYEAQETIPTWLLIIIAVVVPAGAVFLVCLFFVPGPTVSKATPKSLIWKRKIWELNAGLMGLALSLATAFMFTQGMKLIFGKPRPDLISRCQPNLDSVQRFDVSDSGRDLSRLWVLVTSAICRQTNNDILQDGFKSFPSGHSSLSWAGLLYLTLFLSSKFSVAIPFLPPRSFSTNPSHTSATSPSNLKPGSRITSGILPTHTKTDQTLSAASTTTTSTSSEPVVPIRNQAAAPPVYTLILILVPIGAAVYISSTRFTDFRHHGFDIIFGSLLGIVCSWFSFRWYHLPVTRGAGWAWGPRSYQRAWGIGVGRGVYVGTEGWGSKKGQSAVSKDPLQDDGYGEAERSGYATGQRGVNGYGNDGGSEAVPGRVAGGTRGENMV